MACPTSPGPAKQASCRVRPGHLQAPCRLRAAGPIREHLASIGSRARTVTPLRAGFRRGLILGMVVFLAACGGGDSSPTDGGNGDPPPTPAIELALSPSSAQVTAGSSTEIGVAVTRSGGFTGSVTVTASGPDGVAASPLTLAGGSNSGTLVVQVDASAEAGSVSVTIRGNGSGVQEATATLSLTVSSAPITDFQLLLESTSVEVARGSSAAVLVQVARTNFDGAVTLSATGLPSGVTATLDPAAPTGATATLNLSVSTGATLGTATVQVQGSATGIGERTTSLDLTVTEGGGGGSGNVTWSFCDGAVAPLWFAARDGSGSWTRVGPNDEGDYEFQIDEEWGALAWVESGTGFTETQVNFFSREELLLISSDPCRGAEGGKTVNGTVVGLATAQSAFVSLGSSATSVIGTGAASSTFTLERVIDGPQDLVASLADFDVASTSFLPSRGIIRRGLDPADNGTLEPLNFATEGFDLNSATLTVNGAGGDMVTTAGLFFTERGALGAYFAGLWSTTTPTYWGMPANRLESGDFHYLQVSASTDDDGGIPPATRQIGLGFREVEDRTITLGPAHVEPTVTSVGSGSVARLRASWTLQPEYNRSAMFFLNQDGSQQGARSVVMLASDGYIDGSANLELEVPDFSGVEGWNSGWGLEAGQTVIWSVSSTGWTGPGIVSFPVLGEGTQLKSATRGGSITP